MRTAPARAASRTASIAAGLLLAVAMAACSGTGSGTQAPASVPAGGGTPVTIQDFTYQPADLTVAVGTTVTWTNQDVAGHTVTAVDGSFDSKTFGQGVTWSHTFDKAGAYSYVCTIHASMKGTVTVK